MWLGTTRLARREKVTTQTIWRWIEEGRFNIFPVLQGGEDIKAISLASAPPTMASALVKGTRKIRVYPKNPEAMIELIRQQRRAYNLAVASFVEADRGLTDRKGEDLKQTNLRATIRDFARSGVAERGGVFRSADCDESVNAVFRTRNAVIRNRTKGLKCGFSCFERFMAI